MNNHVKLVILIVVLGFFTHFSPLSHAELFGVKSDEGTYSLVIEAEFEKVNEEVIIQNGQVLKVSSHELLRQFIHCSKEGRDDCYGTNNIYFNTELNRFSYINHVDFVDVSGVLKWKQNISFLISYKVKELRSKYTDIITFHCVNPDNCYPVNNLKSHSFSNYSLGKFDLLASLFAMFNESNVQIKRFDEKQYSRISLFGIDSGINIWIKWHKIKKENSLNKLFNKSLKELQSCHDNSCEETVLLNTLGNKADQSFYSLGVKQADGQLISGFVDLSSYLSLFKNWNTCSFNFELRLEDINIALGHCLGSDMENYILVPNYQSELVKNYEVNPVSILLSSRGAMSLAHKMQDGEKLPIESNIEERSGIKISLY